MAAPTLTGRVGRAGWVSAALVLALALGTGEGHGAGASGTAAPQVAGCTILPASSYWNTPVDDLDVHPRSSDWVAAIGRDAHAHADFGSGLYDGGPIGIPYTIVGPDQATTTIPFTYDDESDPGPYPMPADPLIEGGPDSDGDRHVLLLQTSTCTLYELYAVHPDNQGGWTAGSGAVFDLSSNGLRPAGWTSADAA
ncbi:MAG TPA: hypothetical protein VMM13_20480, partial [Euzebya sp.]|nr:hypothetical protein [Euzebya sp.]